jgi:type IV secretory pathway VirD2 relaxase
MQLNHTQFNAADLMIAEAEVAVTNHSMKLHTASKEAVRARTRYDEAERNAAELVRVSGLTPTELVDYFVRRTILTAALGDAQIRLRDAEEAEAEAEYEWELAVEHLTLIQS